MAQRVSEHKARDEVSDVSGEVSEGVSARVSELKARGNAAYQAQRYCQSLGVYARAIHLATTHLATAQDLSTMSHAEGDSGGIGARELAVLLSNRCAASLALGATSMALLDAKRCISTDPSFVKGHLRLGRAHLQAGEWERALNALHDGLALAPADAGLQAALTDAVRQSETS
jgi:translocation protein SEC72